MCPPQLSAYVFLCTFFEYMYILAFPSSDIQNEHKNNLMVTVVVEYTFTDLHYPHVLFAATDSHFGFQELVKTLKHKNIRA